MKSAKLLILFLFIPFIFYGQKTLTGLWTGTLTNDSTAIRQDQSIEIALSQYKQKVTGYSRVTFIINDTLYNIIKRVKGTIDGNICKVIDDDIISHNYPVKPQKKVKTIYTFIFNPQDSIWRLDGKWETTKTKEFYSISGGIKLKEEKDLDKSKLFPHLEELSLADDVDFYKQAKQQAKESIAQQKSVTAPIIKKEAPAEEKEKSRSEPVAVAKPEDKKITVIAAVDSEKIKSEPVVTTSNVSEKKKNDPPKPQPAIVSAPQEKKTEPVKTEPVVVSKPEEKKPENLKPEPAKQNPVAKTESIEKKPEPSKSQPITISPTQDKKPEPVKSEPVVISRTEEKKPAVTNTENKKPVSEEIKNPTEEKQLPVAETNNPKIPLAQPVAEAGVKMPIAAIAVNERKTVSSQTVTFKSDSLQLALYDNGEIDGDTVSVLLNGQIILAKQGLKASAIRKTIYIEPGSDELTLVLYAENLGKYPPNTGLLIVNDGDEAYQVRFSADLQQNAAIILKRRK